MRSPREQKTSSCSGFHSSVRQPPQVMPEPPVEAHMVVLGGLARCEFRSEVFGVLGLIRVLGFRVLGFFVRVWVV